MQGFSGIRLAKAGLRHNTDRFYFASLTWIEELRGLDADQVNRCVRSVLSGLSFKANGCSLS